MKYQPVFPPLQYLIIFLTVIMLLSSCRNDLVITDNENKNNSKAEGGFTDYEGALLFEFNMTRDPNTGKIPEGIRQAELEQAKQIFDSQSSLFGRPSLLNSYIFQGPNNLGGRTRALAYDVRFDGSSNMIILAGGVSNGIFKTTDDGATWVRKSPIGDLFTVTALVQDSRVGSRDTWYYAGGEWTGNSTSGSGASYRGKGVFKSTDNGETWSHLPASNTGVLELLDHRADYVSKLVVDPTTGYVYMAALDAIYRSTDGGTTWGIALTSGSGSFGTGMMSDIVVTSAGRFYAAFAGGSNTGPTENLPGVWSSTTGASGSWTKIAGPTSATSPAGWNAAGAFGRCVLAIPPTLETSLYAVYYTTTYTCGAPAPEAELYRWDDGISTWTDLSSFLPDEPGCLAANDPFAVQGGYDLIIAVKPDVATTVFLGGTNIYRSTSGFTSTGATTRIGGYASAASYALYSSSHPDIHSIAFRPGSPSIMLCGNDGGIQRTIDNTLGTVVWTQINTGYRTYQYYHVTLDPRSANTKVLGGAQDNGSTRNIGGSGSDFESVYGGDGVSVGLSDLISGVQYEYVGSQNGYIYRRASTLSSGSGTDITPTGEGGSGLFVTLFKLDQDNTSEKLYYANDNKLYRATSASTVASGTWTEMTGVGTAVSTSLSITALATTRGAYSAGTSSLFIGASDVVAPISSGPKLFRLDDPAGAAAGTTPVDITGAFPSSSYISSIAVNPRNDDTILVTISNYGVTSVYWTGTANSATPTWTAVEGTLTLPSYRSSAILINGSTGAVEYYVGTSVGLYASSGLPGSVAWAQEGASTVGWSPATSLAVRPSDNKLLVGTHGYGMWYATLPTGPLPVSLMVFKGSLFEKQVLLQWITASEFNTRNFELEKSFDGINFRKITTVPAAGISNTARNYSYLDKDPLTEKNYYRLRTVDMDATSELSNTILIKVPNAQQDMIVLGNPFRDNILVRFTKPPSEKIEYMLFDIGGRVVVRRQLNSPNQQVLIDVPGNLSNGIYQLRVLVDGIILTTKVIKQ